jgi:hypothetical protein
MHIIVTVLSLVGVGLFWWHRLSRAGEAARGLVDAAGRARGAAKRRKFRNKAAESPFAAIDDPIVGAATILIALQEELDGFDDAAERRLRAALGAVAPNGAIVEEAVIYGRWAAAQTAEASTALRLVGGYLAEALAAEERLELLAIAETVVPRGSGDEATRQSLLRALRTRLKV